MAFGVWPFRVFVIVALLWLRGGRDARHRALLSRSRARRSRLLRFIARQEEQRAFFYYFLLRRASAACLQRRSFWVKPRNRTFLNEVARHWSDTEWKENFRLSRATFRFLCRVLQPRLERCHTVRQPLSHEERVAICLWRLGTNTEYRTISHLFGVGLSTVCVCVHDVCAAIVELLAGQYIKFPKGQGLRVIVDGFMSKWGFPQCVGALDGSHIKVIAPKDNPLDYFNRKGQHSVVLQALVDHDYKFLDIYVGWPGSVHDARVLANSSLYSNCESGNLLPNWTRTMGNATVPLVILGDPAYPLRSWLLKPFSDTGLTTV